MGLVVLLPPSEGKSTEEGNGETFRAACPAYAGDVEKVLRHLGKLSKRKQIEFYGVSTKEKAAAVHGLNLAALDAPGLPAIERYAGVVYDHLDFASLLDRTYATEHLLIASGMFGVIPASAPIPAYKLPMNTWLAKFWQPTNGRRMQALAEGQTVLSLLPGAHARALGFTPSLSIDFKLKGGKKSAGHFGKAIKGKFARFLMEHKINDVAGIAKFSEDGYAFDGQNFVQR